MGPVEITRTKTIKNQQQPKKTQMYNPVTAGKIQKIYLLLLFYSVCGWTWGSCPYPYRYVHYK